MQEKFSFFKSLRPFLTPRPGFSYNTAYPVQFGQTLTPFQNICESPSGVIHATHTVENFTTALLKCQNNFDRRNFVDLNRSYKMRLPSNRTLFQICLYTSVAGVTGIMLLRRKLQQDIEHSEYFRNAMKLLRNHAGQYAYIFHYNVMYGHNTKIFRFCSIPWSTN